ncbi:MULTISPECIES: hypothetical protein [Microbacterium]|uniref:hypothetical protein n=1 Tax=Microbacterium TaxID=33882 RepID=UPI001B7CE64E|nr:MULTISPECIES: hypothetical protein [Microbacterium]
MSDPAGPTPPQTPSPSAPESASAETHTVPRPGELAPPAGPVAPHAAWAAPGALPFGPPAGSAPPAGAPGYAPPTGAPGYAPPTGYAPPIGYAPPQGYAAPAGYGGPGSGTAPIFGASAESARGGRTLGIVALVLSLIATVGAAIAVAPAAFGIGLGAGKELASRPLSADFDWAVLTGVRDWVLLAETAFWIGTALGVWALVQGIVALVKGRGRGWAIAAVIIAALGPVVFFVVLQGFLTAGFGAGSGIGG